MNNCFVRYHLSEGQTASTSDIDVLGRRPVQIGEAVIYRCKREGEQDWVALLRVKDIIHFRGDCNYPDWIDVYIEIEDVSPAYKYGEGQAIYAKAPTNEQERTDIICDGPWRAIWET